METLRRAEGFSGQKLIVLPASVVRHYTRFPPHNLLFVTDIGYYPRAFGHYFRRDQGCDQHILIYCIDGEGWFRTPAGRKRVQRNQWFIVPKATPHEYGAHATRPWSIYWIHFCGEQSDFFVRGEGPDAQPRVQDTGVDELRNRMFNEMYEALGSGYSKENIGVMCTSLWRFLGSFLYSGRYTGLINRQRLEPMDAIIEFMKNNVHARLTLARLAQESNSSVSHFCALFKKSTGFAPLQYFLHLKMQRACQLLSTTTFQIKEIAARVGYDDPYFFSRLFKKTMGQSPLQYRTNEDEP